jgi:hypothetical protein
MRLPRRGSAEGVARYAERLQAVDVDLRAPPKPRLGLPARRSPRNLAMTMPTTLDGLLVQWGDRLF